MKSRFLFLLATLAALVAPSWAQLSIEEVTGPPWVTEVYANDVSDDGMFVVGLARYATGTDAFRWSRSDGFRWIDGPGGGYGGNATCVNTDGRVAAGHYLGYAFMWSETQGSEFLPDLPGGSNESRAWDVSGDGRYVVGWGAGRQYLYEAALWDTQARTVLGGGSPTGDKTEFRAVSRDGRTLALNTIGPSDSATYVWTREGGARSVAVPPETRVQFCYGMSPEGGVLVGKNQSTSDEIRPIRWSILGTYEFLDQVGWASSTSLNGEVVVGMVGPVVVAWTPTRGRVPIKDYLLNNGVEAVRDWTLREVTAITPDARYVVGYGTNPQGKTAGWIARVDLAPVREEFYPTEYAFTRGVEIGTNDPLKLAADDDVVAEGQQRFQFSPSFANAEMLARLTVPNSQGVVRATLTVRVKANSVPFSDATCFQEIVAYDWGANQMVVLDRRKPASTEAAIDLELTANDVARFVDRNTGRMDVGVRVFHQSPLSPAWRLSVDQVKLATLR